MSELDFNDLNDDDESDDDESNDYESKAIIAAFKSLGGKGDRVIKALRFLNHESYTLMDESLYKDINSVFDAAKDPPMDQACSLASLYEWKRRRVLAALKSDWVVL